MSQTLSAAIKEDHEEMYDFYNKYKEAVAQQKNDEAERWCHQFMWEVARHAVGEELVVYPLMEKHLGQKGKELADHDRADHLDVKKHLYELDKLLTTGKLATTEFSSLIQEAYDHLKKHGDEEERNDLPLLEEKLEDSKGVAASFNRTKAFAPTRAHPSLPDKGALGFGAFLVTPIDKLRDMFSKFPTNEMES